MATQAQIAAVQQLYVGYMGRAADSAGLAFWANAIATGTATIQSVATGFTLSAEYKAAYTGLANDALVDKVYNNVLGRASDATGKAFWVAALASGSVTAATLVATIVSNLGAQDQTTINNKVFVAQTYTDAAGASYNTTAGTSVLVGVNSTPASVTTAVGAISTGTLAGLVPALGLINASVAAQSAVTAYGTATAGTNVALDTNADGTVTSAEASAVLVTDTGARTTVSTSSTATLNANVSNATAALATEKALVVAQTGGTAAITAYENAFAAQKVATVASTAIAAVTAAGVAGLDVAVTASGSAVTYTTLSTAAGVTGGASFTTAAGVLAFLSDTTKTASAQASLVTELNKVAIYGAEVVDGGVKALAVANTSATVTSTSATLNAITGSTGPGTNAYIADKALITTATALVTAAVAADTKIAVDTVVTSQYAVLNKAVVDAGTAISTFSTANATKLSVQDINGVTAAAPVADANKVLSDVFYFKTAVAASTSVSIANFSAGDSIVLGAGYTYNNGALTTGNGNALEFFLQKTAAGNTQIVVETANYGSADSVVNATTGVVTPGHAEVITLTGVTADHLSVANGIVSYV
ncbi:DUF4214 domain-containing protein [Pseudomonas sp. CCI3.2]|uniref:DUF4214 domain-containing protein n=1 Tax=unclassified Pseudomonas TaxID=196821 RepID=UPI002AC93102|nr:MULTISPECIES: DUF4214 domain-containing protein [unclassified Pseudomonas]MEB0075952.1 DUF4214 domain-containing protein [Pseudomonas sp. MH10out]MEB0101397.1 DUF4214 domain-containing protein [Pseudomonas sp. CCI3.2]MEB0130931.1 DUF4214 domain-containing protein [Pseudomonas sp. CCI2.4]MEB0157909.1 DUF4214 domain-containing protein [Pseudomonas sp. AH2 (2023)]MEB0166386.1 DUF4214 domain-containing protein [Pseudomonas sp. CCC4.4]